MSNIDERLRAIEATQVELKHSIDRSRELAEKAQCLLDKHRQEMRSGPPAEPGRAA